MAEVDLTWLRSISITEAHAFWLLQLVKIQPLRGGLRVKKSGPRVGPGKTFGRGMTDFWRLPKVLFFFSLTQNQPKARDPTSILCKRQSSPLPFPTLAHRNGSTTLGETLTEFNERTFEMIPRGTSGGSGTAIG